MHRSIWLKKGEILLLFLDLINLRSSVDVNGRKKLSNQKLLKLKEQQREKVKIKALTRCEFGVRVVYNLFSSIFDPEFFSKLLTNLNLGYKFMGFSQFLCTLGNLFDIFDIFKL
jgi:hypothetical protein